MQTLKLIVREVRQESPLIRSFRLAREDGGAPARLRSGAHLNLRPRPARAAQLFAGALTPDAGCFAAPAEYRLGVRLEKTARAARAMHARALVGRHAGRRGPRNDFPLHEAPAGDDPVLLIAGGIGITPVASMAAALRSRRPRLHLHYCGLQGPVGLRARAAGAGRRQPVAARRRRSRQPLRPAGAAGRRLAAPAPVRLRPKGADRRRHRRRQGPPLARRPRAFQAVRHGRAQAAKPFEVELRQSGRVLTIPADKTIVDVMEEEGCDPMYDCKRGECGVCQATVLEGEPDHRDYYLSDTERPAARSSRSASRAPSPRAWCWISRNTQPPPQPREANRHGQIPRQPRRHPRPAARDRVHRDLFIDQGAVRTGDGTAVPTPGSMSATTARCPIPATTSPPPSAISPWCMVRHGDRSVRVLQTAARTRGMVAGEACGNTGKFFRCPYHAWTFKAGGAVHPAEERLREHRPGAVRGQPGHGRRPGRATEASCSAA